MPNIDAFDRIKGGFRMCFDAFAEAERTGWDRRAAVYGATTARAADPGAAAALGAEAEGVDVAAAMVAAAREAFPACRFEVADAAALPAPDASFDAALCSFGLFHLADPAAALRDIFIIALALSSCLFAAILVIMLAMIIRLVNMLEFEIKPILEKTNETIGMVRGTTTFVGENVVRPVTKATAYVTGVRRGLKVLFGDPKRNLPD